MTSLSNQVVLVDQMDRAIGVMEKMEAHEKALLHRAFSVFIFNSKNELLLHRRAFSKYHSGGLWTNTCCSHPAPTETLEEATSRRLVEEMGMKCDMQHLFSFVYKAELDQGLTEHEFDHVFIGHSDAIAEPNPEEVAEVRYASLASIRADMTAKPEEFTEWFKIAFDRIEAHFQSRRVSNLN